MFEQLKLENQGLSDWFILDDPALRTIVGGGGANPTEPPDAP